MAFLRVPDFWQPHQHYYSNDRLKSLILENDKFYICSETHISGNEFDETKFILVSGSAGGGLMGNRYAGTWDLSLGVVGIGQAEPSPSRSTGFVKVDNDNFIYVPDDMPTAMLNGFADWVQAEGVSPKDSGIRWGAINIPEFDESNAALGIMFGVTRNTQSVSELLGILFGTNPTTSVSGVLHGYMRNGSSRTLQTYIIGNVTNAQTFNPEARLYMLNWGLTDIPINTTVYFGIDTSTGQIYLQVGTGPILSPISLYDASDINNAITVLSPDMSLYPLGLTDYESDTFSPFYSILYGTPFSSILTYPDTFTFDLGSEADGKLPFLSMSTVLAPPEGALDGEVYLATNGNGTFLGEYIESGNFVEFADSKTKLIITRKPKTIAQIETIATSVAITEAKKLTEPNTLVRESFNVYGGEVVTIGSDTDVVELNGGANILVTLRLPTLASQYAGKRISIVVPTSIGLIVTASLSDGGTLATIETYSIHTQAVYEFMAVKASLTSIPYWLRTDSVSTVPPTTTGNDNILTRFLENPTIPYTFIFNDLDPTSTVTGVFYMVGKQPSAPYFDGFNAGDIVYTPDNVTWQKLVLPIFTEIVLLNASGNGSVKLIYSPLMTLPNASFDHLGLDAIPSVWYETAGENSSVLNCTPHDITGNVTVVVDTTISKMTYVRGSGSVSFQFDPIYGSRRAVYAEGTIIVACTDATVGLEIGLQGGINPLTGTDFDIVCDPKQFYIPPNSSGYVLTTCGLNESTMLIRWVKYRDAFYFSRDTALLNATTKKPIGFTPIVLSMASNDSSYQLPDTAQYVFCSGANVAVKTIIPPLKPQYFDITIKFDYNSIAGVILLDGTVVVPQIGDIYSFRRYVYDGDWYRV